MLSRAMVIWAGLMAAETVHGVLRETLLAPRLGGFEARRIAAISGSAIILAIAYFTIGWVGARSPGRLLAIGALWLGLTLAFEIALGVLVLGYPWRRLAEDYDVSKGGLMLFGSAALLLSPLIASRLRERRGLSHS
jgi:hypothetical protein